MSKTQELVEALTSIIEKHFGGSEQVGTSVEVIKSFDEELMQATHIVYEPNVPDLHDEYMTEETIRKACHNFNTHCSQANLFHRVDTDKVTIAESYILPVSAQVGDEIVKAGSWLAVLQYNDKELWDMEKNGDIQGVSIGALGRRVSND